MTVRLKLLWRLVTIGAYLAFGWIVGLYWLASALVRAMRQWRRAHRGLTPTISCPWCHATVSQYGAFSCPSCHQKTLGWAWECSTCGQQAGFIDCPECHLSIKSPLLG